VTKSTTPAIIPNHHSTHTSVVTAGTFFFNLRSTVTASFTYFYVGTISLCVDLFVFICILCVFVSYCICVVSTVGWTWWYWSL